MLKITIMKLLKDRMRTVADLAKDLQMTRQGVYYAINNENISLALLRKIADNLKVNVKDLV